MMIRILIGLLVAAALIIISERGRRAPDQLAAYLEQTRAAPSGKNVSSKRRITKVPRANDQRAAAIDRFFGQRKAPLAGHGMAFVRAADFHGLDWRLLPAIAWKESLGGKSRVARRYNNPFGVGDPNFWYFGSYEHAIHRTAQMLGGDSRHYREGMRSHQILRVFNTVERPYPYRVMRIMAEVHKS